jgi:DNA-binding SARP family transcriptional activator
MPFVPDPVELRLLGPVQLRYGERQIGLGSSKQRCVLAALGLAEGRPVTVETLIDRVWDQTPPTSCRATLFSYVSRIRRILGEAAESAFELGKTDGGYRLGADPDRVDLWRARALVAAARTRVEAGELEAANRLLADAGGLYQGTALAGLTGNWVDRARHWIGQEYQSLLDLRYETALRLGRHADIVVELGRDVAAFPSNERLAGHLLLALYRCGRVGEALSCYAQTRKTLADELGADPGTELVELHSRILAADPHLCADIRHATIQVRTAFPAALRTFTGRTHERSLLLEKLRPHPDREPVTCVLSGPAGIGKSALAIQVGHQLAGSFPDGAGYVDCTAAPEPLADRSALLVLDNVRDGDQVRSWLAAAPRSTFLIVSRSILSSLDGAENLCLGGLDLADSVRLLVRVSGTEQPAALATELAARCDQLPLALRILGTRMAARPCWSALDWLRLLSQPERRLDELRIGDLSVRTAFESALKTIRGTQFAISVFALLGRMADREHSTAQIAAIAGLGLPWVREALDVLADAHLLTAPAPARYRLSGLLRLFAAEQPVTTVRKIPAELRTGRLALAAST